MNRRTFIVSLATLAVARGVPELSFLQNPEGLEGAKLLLHDASGRILAYVVCKLEGLVLGDNKRFSAAFSFGTKFLETQAVKTGNVAGARLVGKGFSLPVELHMNTNQISMGDEIKIVLSPMRLTTNA